jgi:hypothetical protein
MAGGGPLFAPAEARPNALANRGELAALVRPYTCSCETREYRPSLRGKTTVAFAPAPHLLKETR